MALQVEAAINMLGKLVAFDTTSHLPNLAIIDFIEAELAKHGVASSRHDLEPGRKTNLHATIGPQDRGGIVLSGHTDVVPVEGQTWTSDPFVLRREGDHLFGRGTCDMKGFLACVLAAVPQMLRHPLKTPIHLAFSCDEELGSAGVIPLIASIVARDLLPRMAVVGEPSSMQVINAHKELMIFVTEVKGIAAHSSNPAAGVNAISVAARFVAELESIAGDLRKTDDPEGNFDPPFSTLNIGVISGGIAMNIVPESCVINWEMRLLPGTNPAWIFDRLTAFATRIEHESRNTGGTALIRTELVTTVPGLAPEPDALAEKLAKRFAQRNGASSVSYGTEAGHFQAIGIPTVICGPGNIAQAHRADEFVTVSQLNDCAGFLESLITFCAEVELS
jgi:acetylornithine deacetylase